VLGKKGDTINVTELANRNEGAGFESVENMSAFGALGWFCGQRNDGTLASFDVVAIGNLDNGAVGSGLNIDAVWFGGGV
jgi:hypothetical protein